MTNHPHHAPFQSLSPLNWSAISSDPSTLPALMKETFSQCEILIDSIPPLPSSSSNARTRAQTAPATPSAESLSPEVLKLRRDWSALKPMAASANPHDITVYKLSAKDGKGAWFARRSLHYGMNFEKWEDALRREFGETLIRGEGTEGNIRGLGAEKRVENVEVEGVGLIEVFLVSARFPGPTTPRDFVALHMTPTKKEQKEGPRQFMLISRPCEHDACPTRSGFIRGQYESVEVIREVPVKGRVSNGVKKTMSSVDVAQDGNSQGGEEMAIEWLMVTRSDPGGSVPRFMVEKGTPGGIVSDVGRFIDWFEEISREDARVDEEREESVGGEQVNAEANGAENKATTARPSTLQSRKSSAKTIARQDNALNGERREAVPPPSGFYGMIASALEAAGSVVANRLTPAAGSSVGTGSDAAELDEVSDTETDTASEDSFASAEEGSTQVGASPPPFDGSKVNEIRDAEVASTRSSTLSEDRMSLNEHGSPGSTNRHLAQHEKELRKLQARMRKAQERLERRTARKHRNNHEDDREKDELALAKLREKHEKEIAKQEEKFHRELQKLEQKRLSEERKAEEKRKKQVEKEERANIQMELERTRAERDVAMKQIDILKAQVGELQAQNTRLVARLGKEGIVFNGVENGAN